MLTRLALPLACVVYLALRALVLWSNFDAVAIPAYELNPMGNIGHLALEGWYGGPLPKFYDNCGGHLVTGLLATPVFALFGETYLALKLVPILLGLGSLILVWAITKRGFGRSAAVVATMLFALGPPTLFKYSMLAKGNHFEAVFFELLVVWLFFEMHARERRGPWLLACSFAAGFAVFFYFGALPVLGLLAVTHLAIRGPRSSLRDLFLGLAAFAVGIAPLVRVHLATESRPGLFLTAKFTSDRDAGFLARVTDLVSDKLPRAACFEDLGPIPGRIAEIVFLVTFCAAWWTLLTRLWWRRGSDERARLEGIRALPLLLYLPAFFVLYGVSNFDLDPYGAPVEIGQFRYLVTHFAFATILIGAAASTLMSGTGRLGRGAGRALAGAALATSLFTLPVIDWTFARTGLGTRYDGYFMRAYGPAGRGAGRDPETGQRAFDVAWITSELGAFPLHERHDPYFRLGFLVAQSQFAPGRVDGEVRRERHFTLDEIIGPYPLSTHVDLARGAGSFLGTLMKRPRVHGDFVRASLAQLALREHPMANYVVEGLAIDPDFTLARNTERRLERGRRMRRVVPANFTKAWRRGQGLACGELLGRGIPADVALALAVAESIPGAERRTFWFGVGIGLTGLGGKCAWPEGILERVPGEWLGLVARGFGAGLRHGYGPGGLDRAAQLEGPLPDELRAAVLEGVRWPGYPAPRDP